MTSMMTSLMTTMRSDHGRCAWVEVINLVLVSVPPANDRRPYARSSKVTCTLQLGAMATDMRKSVLCAHTDSLTALFALLLPTLFICHCWVLYNSMPVKWYRPTAHSQNVRRLYNAQRLHWSLPCAEFYVLTMQFWENCNAPDMRHFIRFWIEYAFAFGNFCGPADLVSFTVTALIGLMTLPFDLLTSKYIGSLCDGLPSCQFWAS